MNKLALTAVTLTAGWCLACAAPAPAPQPATATPATPQVAVGAHTATLGLAFYRGEAFPAEYRGGAFLGQHGSWNRSQFSGYKVTFVPSRGGRPSGPMRDFLTGFVADEAGRRSTAAR